MRHIKFILVCLVLIWASQTTLGQKTLPDVTISDLQGKSVNIGDYSRNGKITIISFWALWCKPCIKELNNIKDLYEDWQDEYGVEIIALSIDDSRNLYRVKSHVDGSAWEYIVLIDKNQDMKRALNFQSIPYTLMTDREGNIVYAHSSYVEGDEYILEDEIKKYAK